MAVIVHPIAIRKLKKEKKKLILVLTIPKPMPLLAGPTIRTDFEQALIQWSDNSVTQQSVTDGIPTPTGVRWVEDLGHHLIKGVSLIMGGGEGYFCQHCGAGPRTEPPIQPRSWIELILEDGFRETYGISVPHLVGKIGYYLPMITCENKNYKTKGDTLGKTVHYCQSTNFKYEKHEGVTI